jgi:hypothetical protein
MPSVAVDSHEEPQGAETVEREERSSDAAAAGGGVHGTPDEQGISARTDPSGAASGAGAQLDAGSNDSLPPALTTPEAAALASAKLVAERSPDSANVHTRRTMPPPSLLDDALPSVAARRFPSKQKTLQFAPISPLDAPQHGFEQTPTPSASLLDAFVVPANDDAPGREPHVDEPLVAEIFSKKRSTPPKATPAAAPAPTGSPLSARPGPSAARSPDARAAARSAPAATRSRNRAVGTATPPARAAMLATMDRAQRPAPGPPPGLARRRRGCARDSPRVVVGEPAAPLLRAAPVWRVR